jgi:hypothetical protein
VRVARPPCLPACVQCSPSTFAGRDCFNFSALAQMPFALALSKPEKLAALKAGAGAATLHYCTGPRLFS